MVGGSLVEAFRGWRREGIEAQLACLTASPDATVPAYPKWKVRDLAVHVIQVHANAITALTSSTPDRPDTDLPVTADEDPATIADALRQALDAAETALGTCTYDPIWTPVGPRAPYFWQRRLLREAILHRWDAEQATGNATIPAADRAAELIDEFLDTDIPRTFIENDAPLSGAVTIHAGDRRWTVDMAGRTVTNAPDADAATIISGEATSVWLWLMGRDGIPGTVSVQGDDGSVTVFTDLLGGLRRPSPKN